VNLDECLAMAVGILKGGPDGGAVLDAPRALERPGEATPPRPANPRWTYQLVQREPEGEIRFTELASTASEPDDLAPRRLAPGRCREPRCAGGARL
jgi:hypothetical protein